MLFELFKTFFKIGAFTFGGGYAMLPIIQRELVDNKKIIDEEEFLNAIGLAQVAPGAVAVNTSIYCGYKIKGISGAIVSALGIVAPSFLIILTIAMFLFQYRNNQFVEKAFLGIRPAVVSLIAYAVLKLSRKAIRNKAALILAFIACLIIVFTKISPIFVILIAAAASVLYFKFFKQIEEP